MKPLQISTDVVPMARFKARASAWLKQVRDSGRPIVVTQNGEAAGVVISPADYDRHVHRILFMDSVLKGLDDADRGNVADTDTVRELLARLRSQT
jgi:prevent-host-death family protein